MNPTNARAKQSSSLWALVQKAWIPAVAVCVTFVSAVGMWKVHQWSAPGAAIAVNGPQAPEQFTVKRLTYELFGALGDGGILDYVDIDGHPHQVDLTTLPWSHSETTTLTVVSGSISAHVHGSTLGCRIRVNDVVREEHSVTRQEADVVCRVKSA